MKQKPISSRVWIAASACLLLLLACSLASSPTSEPLPPTTAPPPVETEPAATETPLPSPTPTEVPPTVPVETEPPTEETPSCYKWDQITIDMAGETVCVYGTAYSHAGQSRIDFSPEKNSFFLIDATYYYPELSEGVCIVAEEKVEIFDNKIPFMTLNGDLYKCDPWMEE